MNAISAISVSAAERAFSTGSLTTFSKPGKYTAKKLTTAYYIKYYYTSKVTNDTILASIDTNAKEKPNCSKTNN